MIPEIDQQSSRENSAHSWKERKTAADLEAECRAHMAANDLPFDGRFEVDGEIHRFSADSKKNQLDEWYVCHAGFSRNSKPYLTCTYGSWSGCSPTHIFKSYENDANLSREELQNLKAAAQEKQKQTDARLKQEEEERVRKARSEWEVAASEPFADDHMAYLNKKQVGIHGLRFAKDSYGSSVLIMPLWNITGDIQAVQQIRSDGQKRIHGLKKGNFHLIGEIRENSHIQVAEGYATAATAFQANGLPIVVAVDCGNIMPVIENLRSKYPHHQISILADDDIETIGNPGKTKAEEAAAKHRCKVILPRFPDGFKLPDGSAPTDFNDLLVHCGLDEVKKQLPVKKRHLTAIGIGEFLSLAIPPKKLILSPWLPEQGLAMIYASPGVGKTYLALSISYAIASGDNLLNWSTIEPRKVLYVDGEMPMVTMQERLAKIAKSFDRQPPHSSYLRLITPDLQEKGIRDLSSREGQEDINEYLDDVDLVVLDNLSCLIRTGSENEAESWAPVQEWILALRRAGKAVIFLHHAGKNGQQRGTSKKEDVLDTTIVLKRPNNYLQSNGAKFEIHFQKSRGFEGEKAKPIEASLISRDDGAQQWIFSELEGRDQTRVLELKSEGLTQREIAQELNVSASTVNRWIKEAESGNLRRVK